MASSVTARRRVIIHKALSADHETTLAETSRRGHATRLAQAAAANGVDVVAVLGGDGTLNEAANGLAHTNTALAALPGGSTNVFARIQGLPDDPIDAAGVLLEALAAQSIKRVGLGRVASRYFLFHCGVGFDAAVVENVERHGSWKRWAGHPLFIYAAIDTWLRGTDRRRPPLRVRVGEQSEADATSGFFTVVLNANPYTYLGNRPFNLVPEATLDVPLAVVTLRSLGLFKMVPTITQALLRGDVSKSRAAATHTGVHKLVIECNPPTPYQVDGDHLGDATRLEFTWEANALSLVTPLTEPG